MTKAPLALIPAFNEADHVGGVVEQTLQFVETVLVIDDGSSDRTASVAAAAGATVLRLEPNRGKGAALVAGYDFAREEGVAAVVTLDADGQHDPSSIPAFAAAWLAGHGELVIGARSVAGMPLVRRLANLSGRALLRWSTGVDLVDNQSGYRLVSRKAFTSTMPARTDFAFEVEQILLAIDQGIRITWVPIRTIYGTERSHFHPITDSAAFLRLVLELRRRSAAPRSRDGRLNL